MAGIGVVVGGTRVGVDRTGVSVGGATVSGGVATLVAVWTCAADGDVLVLVEATVAVAVAATATDVEVGPTGVDVLAIVATAVGTVFGTASAARAVGVAKAVVGDFCP